jgi:ABC-type lipoprotein export system ATPase subunit
MGGLTRPTSGSVEWLGRRLNRLHDEELSRLRNQHVGFIFQRLNLIPYLTAEQNVALPLKYRGVPTRQRLEIARECLRQVGLARRTRHFPSELSGGEEQRVAVARALAAAPRLLLADEPTGNVDTSAAETMVELFLGLLEGSAGIVVVTHNLRVAERMQEVIELIDGRLSP